MKPTDPAFPRTGLMSGPTHETVEDIGANGIDVRTYLAGRALTGVIAAYAGPELGLPTPEEAAQCAVQYADALLAALAAKEPPT